VYLERWTIDEMTESTVTLLRSHYDAEFGTGDSPDLGDVVTRAELEVPSDRWSDEVDSVLLREDLTAFINEAVGRFGPPGLREPRSLREGDVYWLVWEEKQPSPDSRIGLEGTEEFLAACRRGLVGAGDVTAAARQAAKRTYFQAVEKTRAKQERGGRPHGRSA
jgi:hypothetical protein